MILQLSLHSPEMTGVIHHSMWLPYVVCGLGWAPEGCQGKGIELRMAQQRPEAWSTGVVELECGRGCIMGPCWWLRWKRRIADVPQAFLCCSWAYLCSLSWASGPGRGGLSPSYENDLRIAFLICYFYLIF